MADERRGHPDELGAALERLTAERGQRAELWERALDRVRAEDASARARMAWLTPARAVVGLAAAACVAVVVGAALLAPGDGAVRVASAPEAGVSERNESLVDASAPLRRQLDERTAPAEVASRALADDGPGREVDTEADLALEAAAARAAGNRPVDLGDGDWANRLVRQNDFYEDHGAAASAPMVAGDAEDDRAEGQRARARVVARSARVELAVRDVETALVATRAMIVEDLGEFIERVTVRGDGEERRASVTLRVRPERVDGVVESLRHIERAMGGKAEATVEGEDVTRRLADLEARLRNERRVEAELLELLAGREDEPLEDLLRVREELAEVRGTIERLSGEESTERGLVRLARVEVEMRGVDGEAERRGGTEGE